MNSEAHYRRVLYISTCVGLSKARKINTNADNYQHFNTNSKGFLSYSYDNNNNANMQVHLFYFNKFLKHTTYLCICSNAVAVHCYNNDIPAVFLACWTIYAQSACVICQSFTNMQTAHTSTYQQAHKRCLQYALKIFLLLVVSIKSLAA